MTVFLEVYGYYKEQKAKSDLCKLKNDLIDELNNIFKEIYDRFKDEKSFYDNFAPSYNKMRAALDERINEVEQLRQRIKDLESYKEKVSSMLKGDATYTEYEEV